MTGWVFAFIAAFALDAVWARYNMATADKRTLAAGVYSVAIYIMNSGLVIFYVVDHWLLVPAVAGAFFGTVASIEMRKRGW